MDFLTLFGLILGFGSIAYGWFLESHSLSFLIQPTALIIVLGGTMGATLVQTSPRILWRSIKLLPWVIFHRQQHLENVIEQVRIWNNLYHNQGILALEQHIENEKNPFVIRAIELLISGHDASAIYDILDIELEEINHDNMLAAKVFEGMGGYSPTIGLIGALIGIIHVMQNITDPESLGRNIAVAFVATIYGVMFANLFFLPISKKLQTLIVMQARFHEMIVAGIVSIARYESSDKITNRLEAYLYHNTSSGLGDEHNKKQE